MHRLRSLIQPELLGLVQFVLDWSLGEIVGFSFLGDEFLCAGLYELFVAHFCSQTLC